VDDPGRLDGVGRLGLDETNFLKATRLAPTRWITGLVDLERGRLLDVVADRTRVAAAWQGKELLRAVYAAAGPAAARAALDRFYHWADGVQIPELSRLAGTVRAWQAEILAFHATDGCSNGPTEAVNLLIKKVKRVGHGFRNFTNYRLRLLLHCGVSWQTHHTARVRCWPPPSAV
jgi:transposase